MTFDEIRKMPTCVDREMWAQVTGSGIHESCLRAYQIVQKIKYLLVECHLSAEAMLELIGMMENEFPKEDSE